MSDEHSEPLEPETTPVASANLATTVLLPKELDELNTWLRTVVQIYFAWYTVYITTSSAALIWIFGKDSGTAEPKRLLFGIVAFMTLSILSIPAPFIVAFYIRRMHQRVGRIYDLLQGGFAVGDRAQSSIPITMLSGGLYLTAAAILSMSVIWVRLFWVYIHVALAKPQ